MSSPSREVGTGDSAGEAGGPQFMVTPGTPPVTQDRENLGRAARNDDPRRANAADCTPAGQLIC